jgi:hypothetical protein
MRGRGIDMNTNYDTYFAEDGTYGNAKGLLVLDTELWTEDDWHKIDTASDNERATVALSIANEKKQRGKQ